ncbi:hypothetical protein L6R52_23870 [Myxococcota bacterium]|nr:hypothetical protein [Myxococcota bacterium]
MTRVPRWLARPSASLLLSALALTSACSSPTTELPAELDESLAALVTTIDGVALFPPLGTETPSPAAPFDASLAGELRVVLEEIDGASRVSTLATFDARSSVPLRLFAAREVYFVNVPAAAYFTDPALAYRFRVLLGAAELARADLSGHVFVVMQKNPGLLVGVKIRVEQRVAPSITSITPSTVVAGADALTLTIDGAHFTSDAIASIGGRALATTKVSTTRVTAIVPADELATIGQADVSVTVPAPGGGTSGAAALVIQSPRPMLASIAPDSARAGSEAVVVTLAGADFLPGASARVGGAPLATTWLSSSELTATIPATLLAAEGTLVIDVVNPSPSAGASATLDFTVTPALPAYTPNDPAHPSHGCVDLLERGLARSGLYWIDPTGGDASDAFQAWCDMTTDGGGWMLVAVIRSASTFAGGEAIWHGPGAVTGLTPSSAEGLSVAWSRFNAAQLSFHTHSEAEGRWASFDLPSPQSMQSLVGTTLLSAVTSGTYRATITPRGRGGAANTCFDQPWRVTWRDYWSSDNYTDSSIFAPSGAATGRPCGGATSYATGLGVRTDSNNGFSGYGGSFEGYGADTSGNAGLTSGQVNIYVRERTPVVTNLASVHPRSCSEIATTTSGFYTIDPSGGDPADAISVWCDQTTAGGGWTLVMVTTHATNWAAGSSTWHTPGTSSNVGPNDADAKSFAYGEVAGREILIRTHGASSTSWASFRMTARRTMLDLVGRDNIQDAVAGTARNYLVALAQGPTAHACFAQDWRASWSGYWSGDNVPDSSIFAPGDVSSARSCGGSTSYATGIGVRTDTSNGWSGYGATFAGGPNETYGNTALASGYVALYVREGSALTNLPRSCSDVTGRSGIYLVDPSGGSSEDAQSVWCDTETDGGGWTLVLSSGDSQALAAGNAIWHDTTFQDVVTPTWTGKARAYSELVGTEVLFRFNQEAAGNWASFTMPSSRTMLDLVGTTNVNAVGVGTYRATLTPRSRGAAAHACLNQSWRVSWRDYYSADNYPDSSVFAPSGAATGRPCGGSTSYATGIGVRTDTSNGFSGYGGSFEGYGSDTGGNTSVTRGHVTIYVR